MLFGRLVLRRQTTNNGLWYNDSWPAAKFHCGLAGTSPGDTGPTGLVAAMDIKNEPRPGDRGPGQKLTPGLGQPAASGNRLCRHVHRGPGT